MPRAELHLHLEGAIELETLREIDPSLTADEIREATTYSDFMGFIRAFVWVNRKLREPRHYALAARRLFEKLHREGLVYAEVTLSAGVVLWKQQDLGAVFDAVAGESARSPIPVRWILDATRQWGPDAARPVFRFAAERRRDGVVAIGIGGVEAEGPAHWYADTFQRARDAGLRTIAHAGETTNAQSVWDALKIGAERIGHGIRAIDDPELLEELLRRDIPLEISISSNVCTGAVASVEDHPVRRLYDAGVPIILNTDDPAMFHCSLASEYDLAGRVFGFTAEEIAGIEANSLRYAFGPMSGAIRDAVEAKPVEEILWNRSSQQS